MAKWEEEVKKDYDEIVKTNNLIKINFSSWKTGSLLTIFLIVGTIVIFAISCYFSLMRRYVIALIGTIICFLFIFFLVLISKAKSRIWQAKDIISNSLNFSYYYSLALKELSNNKYQLSSITTDFDISPINFLPKKGKNKTDEVLNFFCDDIKYSYGTITNERTKIDGFSKSTGFSTTTQHTRYCYLNLYLSHSTNLEAIIQKSKSFLKIFKTPDNTDLESTEFENIYSVEANDQIMIRKLLKPKIQQNLVELAYAYENRPRIAILNQQITFAFDNFLVSNWDDPEGRIMAINFKGKASYMAEIICEKIKRELDLLFCALFWAKGFEFFRI